MKKHFLLYLLTSFLISDQIMIEGNIFDANSKPINNVNIYSNISGTSTNQDGYFKLSLDEADIVNISHIKFRDVRYIAKDIPSKIILHHSFINANQIVVNSNLTDKNLTQTVKGTTVIDPQSNESLNDFSDYVNSIPNVSMIPGTSKGRYFRIRGIGEMSQFAGEGPPIYSVSYYLDDIDLSGIGTIANSFNLQSIKVSKGIDNLTSGYNSLGGSINLYSKNPTNKKQGLLKIDTNDDDGYSLGLSYSCPIGSNLLSRTSIYKNYSNGYIKNNSRNIDNSNQIDENLIHSKILWLPSKNNNFILSLLHYNNNNGYDIWTPDNNGFTTYTDFNGQDKLKTSAFSLINNINLNDVQYKSSISFTQNDIVYNYDGDWGDINYWGEDWYWAFPDKTNRKRETLNINIKRSQKINNINFIVGTFNALIKESDKRVGWVYGGNASSINTNFDIMNNAIYSQFEFNKGIFNIDFGARYDMNTIDYLGDGEEYDPVNFAPLGTTKKDTLSYTDNELSASLSLNHKITKTISHSIQFSRGYKPGGINQSFILDSKNRTYDKETNLSFEYIVNYNQNRLSSKINLFYVQRNNPQVRLYYQFDPSIPTTFDFYTANADKGDVMGAEISFKVFLNKNLSISQDLGLLKNRLNQYVSQLDGRTYGNRESAHSPIYNYKTEASFNSDIGIFGLVFFGDLIITGSDKYYYDDQEDYQSTPYQLIHINTGFNYNNFKISFWAKNIFDEKYATRAYFFDLGMGDGQKLYKAYGNPRTIGATLSYQF